jgi:hypothetical protein
MQKRILLCTFICISAFTSMQSVQQKLDFKEKFGFLQDAENHIFSNAIREIKWRIRSGYLAELNRDLNAMRWLVKKLAQHFGIKTTTIAARLGTPAAYQYIEKTNQYLEMVENYGDEHAEKYQKTLYPEYYYDLYRSDEE